MTTFTLAKLLFGVCIIIGLIVALVTKKIKLRTLLAFIILTVIFRIVMIFIYDALGIAFYIILFIILIVFGSSVIGITLPLYLYLLFGQWKILALCLLLAILPTMLIAKCYEEDPQKEK